MILIIKKIKKRGVFFSISILFRKSVSILVASFCLLPSIFWAAFVRFFLESLMDSYSFRRAIPFRKSVLILGAGPSLDEIDISKIHNSTVLLLNNSWRLHKKIPPDNDVYFYCQDIRVFNELIHDVSRSLKKIILIASYSMSFSVLRDIWLFRENYYLVNVPSFNLTNLLLCKESEIRGHVFKTKYTLAKFGGHVSPIMRIDTFERVYLSTSKAWLSPWSVMLSAVYNSHRWGGERIVSCGFDASYFLTEHKYAKSASVKKDYNNRIDFGGFQEAVSGRKVYGDPKTQPSSWGTYRNLRGANLWGGDLLRALERDGCCWVNASSKTFIDSVPILPVADIDKFLKGVSNSI